MAQIRVTGVAKKKACPECGNNTFYIHESKTHLLFMILCSNCFEENTEKS